MELNIKEITHYFLNEKVLNNVSFCVKEKTTFGILGESGSGKTTLAKIISGLLQPTQGGILYDNSKLSRKEIHSSIRLIFQNPEATLNPAMKLFSLLEEPLKIYKKDLNYHQRCREIEEILLSVNLNEIIPFLKNKRILELSGGQRRRLAIARALVVKPKLLIADEPTAGLDQSLQGTIINLLRDLKMTKLIITHNLAVAASMADTIGIFFKGNLIEELFLTEKGIGGVKHPFSVDLIDANFNLMTTQTINSNISTKNGCSYLKNCTVFEKIQDDKCSSNLPNKINIGYEHFVCCHKFNTTVSLPEN
jgi:peptide/nickel transport system ATP-binding protein